jgi:tetratricopeptide (TPR) repeat protein
MDLPEVPGTLCPNDLSRTLGAVRCWAMDRHERIWALFERGSAHEREHDLGPARQLLNDALEAASAAGMWEVARNCHQLLGVVAHKADRLDEARAHLTAALTLALDASDRIHEAYAHQELGFVLLHGGAPRLALWEFHTELALAQAP